MEAGGQVHAPAVLTSEKPSVILPTEEEAGRVQSGSEYLSLPGVERWLLDSLASIPVRNVYNREEEKKERGEYNN